MVRLEVLVILQLTSVCLSQFGRDVTSTDFIFNNETLSCTAEIQKIPNHTLCLTDNIGVTKSGISMDDKKFITDKHNNLRSKVEPPAEDLLKLLWDERVASVAQKWANQCNFNHDTVNNVPGLEMDIGQNIAAGHVSWNSAIQRWYDEKRDFTWGQTTYDKEVGHFLQVVRNGTLLIGCGYAVCPDTIFKRFYVCNYAEQNGPSISISIPYIPGTRCGACINHCNNGLCDCGGLICENGGKLELSNCTCACPKLYKGTKCEQENCPASDPSICGAYPDNYCETDYNIRTKCPYKCGLCKSPCGDLTCENGGTLSFDTCTCACPNNFYGIKCEQVNCPTDDASHCFAYTEDYCSLNLNVRADCPYKCGVCERPCEGLICKNGGTLVLSSCTCACPARYTGTKCEQVICPPSDEYFCADTPNEYCQLMAPIRELCPYKCGVCQ